MASPPVLPSIWPPGQYWWDYESLNNQGSNSNSCEGHLNPVSYLPCCPPVSQFPPFLDRQVTQNTSGFIFRLSTHTPSLSSCSFLILTTLLVTHFRGCEERFISPISPDHSEATDTGLICVFSTVMTLLWWNVLLPSTESHLLFLLPRRHLPFFKHFPRRSAKTRHFYVNIPKFQHSTSAHGLHSTLTLSAVSNTLFQNGDIYCIISW